MESGEIMKWVNRQRIFHDDDRQVQFHYLQVGTWMARRRTASGEIYQGRLRNK